MPLTVNQTQTATILVVDDTPENLTLMVDLFAGLYTTKVANGGERALYIARHQPVDLILLEHYDAGNGWL